jgi:hypothetical protein
MSARRKLNGLYAGAAAVSAAFVGLAFQSWWGFAAALAVLVALNVVSGNIRPAAGRR